jgi:thiol-disulfide isomerase/thioredoxin
MKPRRRELLIAAAVAAVAGTAGFFVRPSVFRSAAGVDQLFSARLPDLSGRMRLVSEWKGRPTVFNFWATWCEPCREETPLLIAVRSKFLEQGVSFVGIGIDKADKIRQFAAKFAVPYTLLVADWNEVELLKQLGNSAEGLPFTVVIDHKGDVAFRKLGAIKPGELEEVLPGLLR